MIGPHLATVQTLGEGDTLRDLVRRLDRAGYAEYYAAFNPLAPRPEKWERTRENAPQRLGPLLDLFLLNRVLEAGDVAADIGDLVEPLCQLGLLESTSGGRLATPSLVLLPIAGAWLFCQAPAVNPAAYFGDDSMALLMRLRPRPGGRCLELCAGAGIQSLYCSRFAAEVDAVEINPVVAALAQVNAVMNGREAQMRVHCGDLYTPVHGRSYDTIVANPPLLPFPDEIAYPFVGHGGTTGLRVTQRILDGLPQALAPDGIAQLIGTCLSDGFLPLPLDRLEMWSQQTRMDMLMSVLSYQPLAPGTQFFEGMVYTAAATVADDPSAVATSFQRFLAEQGATHLCPYFLYIAHGSGRFDYQDLAPERGAGLWYI